MDISRKFVKAKKPQGQIGRRPAKVFPKARIGSLIGTEKSRRPSTLKGIDPLKIKTHIDQNSRVSQATVAYFGYADAGSFEQQRLEGCKALVNMFFRRSGMKMASVDQTLSDMHGWPATVTPNFYWSYLTKIVITFANVSRDAANDFEDDEIAVGASDSITSVATALSNMIVDKANGNVTTVVKWPVRATLFTQDSSHNNTYTHRSFASYDLSNVMVDFKFMRKYKWQNVTPAGDTGRDGATNINDIMANPLSGRVYKFKGPAPQIRDQVKLILPTIDGVAPSTDFAEIEYHENGMVQGAAFRHGRSFDLPVIGRFAQPFKANQYFKNCETEDKLYMPPGGYKQLIRQGTVTMNFKRFMQATTRDAKWDQIGVNADPNALKPAKIGTSTLWALEPALRTTTDEEVRLHVNYETWYTTKCRMGDKKQPVATSMIVSDGPDFGAT